MKQLTIRGIEHEVERCIKDMARKEGLSLNQVVLRLLRKGAGFEDPPKGKNSLGSALDEFIGTWTDSQARELMNAVKDFETVDESLWK